MSRTSSPGIYSRNSSKSIPRPLKWLRYAPTIVSFTRRLVLTSTRRTDSNNSVIVIRPSDFSWHWDSVKDLFDNRIRRHRLGFRFVRQNQPMPQHVRPDALHIFRRHVGPALQQRPGFGRQRQIDCRSRRGAELDEMLDVEFVLFGFARREDQVD